MKYKIILVFLAATAAEGSILNFQDGPATEETPSALPVVDSLETENELASDLSAVDSYTPLGVGPTFYSRASTPRIISDVPDNGDSGLDDGRPDKLRPPYENVPNEFAGSARGQSAMTDRHGASIAGNPSATVPEIALPQNPYIQPVAPLPENLIPKVHSHTILRPYHSFWHSMNRPRPHSFYLSFHSPVASPFAPSAYASVFLPENCSSPFERLTKDYPKRVSKSISSHWHTVEPKNDFSTFYTTASGTRDVAKANAASQSVTVASESATSGKYYGGSDHYYGSGPHYGVYGAYGVRVYGTHVMH